MSNANIAYDDRAEDKARAAALKQWGIDVTKPAQVVSLDAKRRPLGLAPVPGDDDGEDRAAASAKRDIGEEVDSLVRTAIESLGGEERCRGNHPTMMDEFETLSVALKIALEGDDDLYRSVKAKFGEVRSDVARVELENAQLRASVAELRAKQNEHEFILERLKVENKGPVGPRGMMGRDGHEGRPGARGERGERGERGSAAPMIVGWRIDSDRYLVTPQYSDGSSGPPLNLSAFVSDEDETDE